MKKIDHLCDMTYQLFQGLRTGDVDPKVGREMSNAAGKTIGILRVQLMYHLNKKEQPKIAFMEEEV